MIKNDHLWWIKSTYDGWRRLKMLFWAIRASIPTKNYENKTGCVFFQGASDGNAPGRRNLSQKSKNKEKLNFKNRFFECFFHQDRCPDVFFGCFHPWDTPKIKILRISQKLISLCFIRHRACAYGVPKLSP